MLKITVTAVALALASMSPALAQSGDFIQKQTANEMRSSKLVGTNVYGPGDEKIGDINEVLIDKSGSVHAVVIGVGGFLGVGEKNGSDEIPEHQARRQQRQDQPRVGALHQGPAQAGSVLRLLRSGARRPPHVGVYDPRFESGAQALIGV